MYEKVLIREREIERERIERYRWNDYVAPTYAYISLNFDVAEFFSDCQHFIVNHTTKNQYPYTQTTILPLSYLLSFKKKRSNTYDMKSAAEVMMRRPTIFGWKSSSVT